MDKRISLHIPSPCSQKWDNFTPTSTGGFCSSCSKTVIDFTKMNDEEILDYFSRKSSSTCGRFRADQIKSCSERTPIVQNRGFTLLKAGVLSLLFVFGSKQGSAQHNYSKAKSEVAPKQLPEYEENTFIGEEHTIKGVVISGEDNQPLPGVNIQIKGTNTGTRTDIDGRFEISQKLKEGDILLFHFIGFETKEYVVPKNAKEFIEIRMVLDEYVLMGEVAVSEPYTENDSGFRKWWFKLRGWF